MLSKEQLVNFYKAMEKKNIVEDVEIFNALEMLIDKSEKMLLVPMKKESYLSLKCVNEGLVATLAYARQVGQS
jgi:hypothetical protein